MSNTDELAIRRTLDIYPQLIDDGRFDLVAQLFTDDATLLSRGTEAIGRAGIVAWFDERYPESARGAPGTAGVSILTTRATG